MSKPGILIGSDALSELLSEQGRNARHDIWLWLYLHMTQNARFDPRTCCGLTMRDEIAVFLKRKKYASYRIAREKDRSLIPDESLTWIDEDERQYQWLLCRLTRITEVRLPRGVVHLKGREHLIAIIDIWNADLEEKAHEAEALRKEWLRHKVKDSAFEWFGDKKDGAKRCACAWEWLEKDNRLVSDETLTLPTTKSCSCFSMEQGSGVTSKRPSSMR